MLVELVEVCDDDVFIIPDIDLAGGDQLAHRPRTITRPQEATARTRSPLVAALVHGDVGLPTRQMQQGFLAGFNVNKLQ
jgi:hypothetical protein